MKDTFSFVLWDAVLISLHRDISPGLQNGNQPHYFVIVNKADCSCKLLVICKHSVHKLRHSIAVGESSQQRTLGLSLSAVFL